MTELKFPKPVKRVKIKKRLTRVRKTPLAKLKREADKLAGEKCRARGVCRSCGAKQNLQWAHVIARAQSAKIRWDKDNCLCLCQNCHFAFTNHPDKWWDWLEFHYPGLHARLMARIKQFENVKLNREYMENIFVLLKV